MPSDDNLTTDKHTATKLLTV